MIVVEDVHYSFYPESGPPVEALAGVDATFEPGRLVMLFGHNGSGKSTLAKHLNGLLTPERGDVTVGGVNTRDHSQIWTVRQRVGMVSQNPDNQIVATVVEDDVAFGAENLGLDPAEIQRRVDTYMALLGIDDLKEREPHLLSGGQKQLVSIAGVLVMQPDFVVLDEPTSLLSPQSRVQVLDAAERLAHEEGLGVILITHFMEEAVKADRVLVMEDGRTVLSGTPREVFSDIDTMRELRLDVPTPTQVAARLRGRHGFELREDILTVSELVAELTT